MNRAATSRSIRAELTRAAAWCLGGPLIQPLLQVTGAAIVSVGPWIVAVVALAVISMTMQPVMGLAAIEDLRLTVVYAFGIAPLVAGPVGAVAAQLVRASVEERGARLVPEIVLVATLIAGATAQGLAVIAAIALGIEPLGTAIGLVFLSTAAALLWTNLAVLGALRAYRFLVSAFSAGMVLSVTCTLLTARSDPTVELLIWSFTVGIVFCVGLALCRVWAGHRTDDRALATAFWLVLGEMRRRWRLCLGILFAICCVWADKWVLWFGAAGLRSDAGFLHYSPYDSVMFVAHLSMIPSLAAMLMFQDGPLHREVRRFRSGITRGATYATIRAAAETLESSIWRHVFGLIFIQAACAAGLILIAPLIAQGMNFNLDQLDTLRVGILAVFLQAIFYFSFSVLVICGRVSHFFWLQTVFLVLNTGLSLVLASRADNLAYGVFAASLIIAMIAFVIAFKSLSRYVYLVFVGENEALYAPPERGGAEGNLGPITSHLRDARSEWHELATRPSPARA